jgi:hypothetical protein
VALRRKLSFTNNSLHGAVPSANAHDASYILSITFNGMIRMFHNMIRKALDLRSLSMKIGTFIKALLPFSAQPRLLWLQSHLFGTSMLRRTN